MTVEVADNNRSTWQTMMVDVAYNDGSTWWTLDVLEVVVVVALKVVGT